MYKVYDYMGSDSDKFEQFRLFFSGTERPGKFIYICVADSDT